MGPGLRRVALFTLVILLSGCALPLPVKIASWALDGISFVATKKSITDHGISVIAGRDCAMMRAVTKGRICDQLTPSIVVVDASGGNASAPSVTEVAGVNSKPTKFKATRFIAFTASLERAAAVSRLPTELRDLLDSNLGMFSVRGNSTALIADSANGSRQ